MERDSPICPGTSCRPRGTCPASEAAPSGIQPSRACGRCQPSRGPEPLYESPSSLPRAATAPQTAAQNCTREAPPSSGGQSSEIKVKPGQGNLQGEGPSLPLGTATVLGVLAGSDSLPRLPLFAPGVLPVSFPRLRRTPVLSPSGCHLNEFDL